MRNLLVEIGTEELPPKALRSLGEAFARVLFDQVRGHDLITDPEQPHRWFATPRRLAAWIPGVRSRQPDRIVERRGPARQVAFGPDGTPTPAALGFAKSCGVAVDKLETLKTDKGEWLAFRQKQKGAGSADLIPECVAEAIRRLPIPKRMRWGDLDAEFVRPVHWLVILHGKSLIKANLLAVNTGTRTFGHRFHTRRPIRLTGADDYEQQLDRDGMVIADFDARRTRIRAQVEQLAAEVGGRAIVGDALLDEVTGLVEWPQALIGRFDEQFLEVPAEALISSMKDHQKYFHVVDERHHLKPYFITVSNINSREPQRVIAGNERVLRARLADARFFWETDLKQPLAARIGELEHVLFHRRLGSVADKCRRMAGLAESIAVALGADRELCRRAAQLSKADLTTQMVAEFPELQGIMGRYYANHDKEPSAVAMAIEEHYLPRFAGDTLPQSDVGRVTGLADRIDSLVGMFGAGEEPSGERDPYGLRRTALGVLRLSIESQVDIDLSALLVEAAGLYRDKLAIDQTQLDRISTFLFDRLKAYYTDRGFGSDEIAAVMQTRPPRPVDFDRRLRAVARFRKLAAAEQLAAANKRIRNILRQADTAIPDVVDDELLQEHAEVRLAAAIEDLKPAVAAQFGRGDYAEGLSQLASLREPVDLFFDQVMVMTERRDLRENRLALLKGLQRLFLGAADISTLQTDKG